MFLFDSHLAMAYWGAGQQSRAIEILTQALSKRGWPETYGELSDEQRAFIDNSMGWNEGLFDFYRKTETHLLKLMKLRLAEPVGAAYDAVDAIFDDGKKPAKAVKFVNDDGKFEPGRVAAAELRKLQPGSLEIVEQLTLWLPEDLRLYWLLGEFANAQWSPEQLTNPVKRDLALDNLRAANKIFDELVYDFKIRAADLRDRRQILHEYMETIEAAPPSIAEFEKKVTDELNKNLKATMDTRTIVITFAAGMAVGIFAIWQFQELRRRRRGG